MDVAVETPAIVEIDVVTSIEERTGGTALTFETIHAETSRREISMQAVRIDENNGHIMYTYAHNGEYNSHYTHNNHHLDMPVKNLIHDSIR